MIFSFSRFAVHAPVRFGGDLFSGKDAVEYWAFLVVGANVLHVCYSLAQNYIVIILITGVIDQAVGLFD